MPTRILDTILLLALPASGKSEVRRYLATLDPETCARDFHLGPTVQLDDFPYVHLMRRVDEVLGAAGEPGVFFRGPDQSFTEPRDWQTLVELLNEDFAALAARGDQAPARAAPHLLDRLDRARARVGADPALGRLAPAVRGRLEETLEPEARELVDDLRAGRPDTLEGKTIVIELARGGPQGSSMPLPAPLGYAGSLARFSPELLERAGVLYVWVTPEESRRKNDARADPDDPGSILHHGVPLRVMLDDYGCDDMAHLVETSDRPGTIRVAAHGRHFHLPVARFDNRVDKTSFVRKPRAEWRPDEIRALHDGLREALAALAGRAG